MDLSALPRRNYTSANPTPIEFMPRLSLALGNEVNLWIKRDDLVGNLAGGGNKARKLEFVIADAISKGADTIVTCGAVQSNHCRLTLAACVREGLKCSLVIEERIPGSYDEDATGNNYLFHLLGAEYIEKVGLNESSEGMETLANKLREEGRNVYIIPGGASNEVGATGYCACAQEIQYQIFSDRLPSFHALVTASGSGGTHAGLVAGTKALRSNMNVIGISTRASEQDQTKKIAKLARETYNHVLGRFNSSDSDEPMEVKVFDNYVGPGYSLPTDGMREAVTLFARTEGILLDPVYTGKVAAGLIDLVRKGYFPPGSNVLFLHTGGAPSLYHYQPIDHSVSGCPGKVHLKGYPSSNSLNEEKKNEM